ncbi:MAG: NAD(P)/FAD-dependent oxidoreductase [Gammaproteobacteria bacterium]|jgi:sulfide:quinone oxidoreductase|nr:NAD(P)/FAD-dependent oxidoreductase [Gammaproteobacteria bacterium]MBU0771323.1 NAD(P)/FAD-dependent oxidoreductase [Gammaproteobacteria bacterium]MBU0858068.1 NAD(P)/FAD-dependent oxidoreductase [Gammaproteobacteria bacterium]MBU1847111.1 NAD(P)/FAD-dependent oxidoreductase [Gammaproteobacteria bacterium]
MRILIVGAGIGGTILANLLARRLREDLRRGGVTLTVLSASPSHLYQPGLLYVALGEMSPAELYRDERELLDPLVRFEVDPVTDFMLDAKKVATRSGAVHDYDLLVIATGSRTVPEEVPGLAGNAHSFYTEDAALRMCRAVQAFDGGKVVIVMGVPHKCPMAPLEMTFLLHEQFVRRGIERRVDMLYTYPVGRLHSIENVARWAAVEFDRRGIRSETFFNLAEVDGANRLVRSEEGSVVEYDLLIAIPPHHGAPEIERAGLGARGWIPTHRRHLTMQGQDDVYVIGDTTNLPISKAGSTARFQAELLCHNIAARVRGCSMTRSYDGKVFCFIETGRGRASYASFNYDEPPEPPSPSRSIQMLKTLYHRMYWASLKGLP